jgi:hypothetical protein
MFARIERYGLTERRRSERAPIDDQVRARRIARQKKRHRGYSFLQRGAASGNLRTKLLVFFDGKIVGPLVIDQCLDEHALLLFAISEMKS